MIVHAYTDGASRGNPGESGIGVILKSEDGEILFSGGGYIGSATNNIAEYSALICCLKKAGEFNCSNLVVHSDSELLVRQMNGKYRVKSPHLKIYFQEAKKLVECAPFQFTIRHIERSLNRDADFLANIGIDSKLPIAG
jgi:ribonuclease HI